MEELRHVAYEVLVCFGAVDKMLHPLNMEEVQAISAAREVALLDARDGADHRVYLQQTRCNMQQTTYSIL